MLIRTHECLWVLLSAPEWFWLFEFIWDQDISSSGHKFELPKKSNLCPHPHISQASVQCWIFILAWLKYMYDVPLSPVYNWPHQVVRYQVTHFSVLLLWPWLPPPPPHGCQRASGETWKSSLNTFVQLTLPRMAYQIMWLSLGGGIFLHWILVQATCTYYKITGRN